MEEKPLPITLKTSCKDHEHITIIYDVFKVIKCIIVNTAPLLLPLGGLCHQNEPTGSPCSAGIGRTGTLITIGIALGTCCPRECGGHPAIVTKMRRQRMKVVQNSVRKANIYLSIKVQRLEEYAYNFLLSYM